MDFVTREKLRNEVKTLAYQRVLSKKRARKLRRMASREHILIYAEAMIGFKAECVRLLEERLSKARLGKVDLTFRLLEPTSYVEQYDTIIEMLEWTTETTIEVSMGEFNAWVRDRWDWQSSFLTSSSDYSATAMIKSASL